MNWSGSGEHLGVGDVLKSFCLRNSPSVVWEKPLLAPLIHHLSALLKKETRVVIVIVIFDLSPDSYVCALIKSDVIYKTVGLQV